MSSRLLSVSQRGDKEAVNVFLLHCNECICQLQLTTRGCHSDVWYILPTHPPAKYFAVEENSQAFAVRSIVYTLRVKNKSKTFWTERLGGPFHVVIVLSVGV